MNERRTALELMILILTSAVAFAIVGGIIFVFVLKIIDPTADVSAVVLTISELVAAVIGFLVGQSTRPKPPAIG